MNKQRILHTVGLAVVSGLAWLAVDLKNSPYWWAPAAAALAAALVVQLPKVAPSIFGPMLVLLALGGSASCWLTKPPPVTPSAPDGGFVDASPGQTFVDCSETALHAGALDILPAVETALALGDYEVELAKLVGSVGLAEVECAVSWAVAIAEQQRAQTADSLEATKVSHGRAWQAAHPVTFAAVAR